MNLRSAWGRWIAVLAVAWGVSWATAQVPATDPPVAPADQVHLVPSLSESHSRLLVSDAEMAALRDKALAPGNPFYAQLSNYLLNPPTNTSWLTDATDAQRQGYWRLPSNALHYAISGSTSSFDKAKGFMDHFLAQPQWELGTEDDSGMGAGNIMLGAAIGYDLLHDDLTPEYREQFRTKLLSQARKMYYLGHLQQNADSHYWQQDPQNNHRWHRDAGLALAVLAVADPNRSDDDWILMKTKQELDFLHRWLPPDGSNHEGPQYQAFGADHLTLAFAAADRALGTNYLDHPFFRNVVDFRLATLTPGFGQVFAFGDASTGAIGSTNNYLFLAAAHHGLADQQAALMKLYEQRPDAFTFGWMSVLWHDPNLTGGSIDNLSKKQHFSDVGLAVVRDGWDVDDVAMTLKSGPYGGKTLNEYRNANNYHYINVAHDDPDANSFQIYARGQMLAQPDGYSYNKRSAAHNTILVNGQGQKGEGGMWTQPLSGASRDMSQMAGITWFEDRGAVTIMEGEAAGAYTGLSRYRRTAVFNEGKYILILDDIRATSVTPITWLVQSEAVDEIEGNAGRFALRTAGVSMPFTLRGDTDYTWQVATSVADQRNTSMGLKQLQAAATTDLWRTGALFDAWDLGELDLTWISVGPLITDLVITGPGFSDHWRWDSTGTQTVLTQAPEPATAGLLLIGTTLLLRRRSRRN